MTHTEQNRRQKQQFMHWFKDVTTTTGQDTQTAEKEEPRNLTRRTLTATATQTATTSTNNGTYEQSTSQFQTNIKKVSGRPASHLKTNPLGIKTHIARISYDCGRSTQRTKSEKSTKKISPSKRLVSAAGCSERTTDPQEKFTEKKKKKEEDRELKEMQEKLNVTYKKIEPIEASHTDTQSNKENEDSSEVKMAAYRRSHTDLDENKIKPIEAGGNVRLSRKDIQDEQTDKPRSTSARLSVNTEESKKTPRKSEATHRLAEAQKPKRKLYSQLKHEKTNKDKLAKEEIKKRLEQLRKNTKKLVNKNLQQKRLKDEQINSPKEKKDTQNNENQEEQKQKQEKNVVLCPNEAPEPLDCNRRLISKGHLTDRPRSLERSQSISRSALSLHTNIIKASPIVQPNPLGGECKRIGLLRKPGSSEEYSLNGSCDLNFDKENVALKTTTSRLTLLTDKLEENKRVEVESLDKKEPENPQFKKTIEERLLKPLEGLLGSEKNNDKIERDLQQLKKAKTEENIGFIKESKEQTKCHDLPYWLKPSAAQVYPYNFILAVRRKLEAITQVPDNQEEQKRKRFITSENEHIYTSISEEEFKCEAMVPRSSVAKSQVLKKPIKSKCETSVESLELKSSRDQQISQNSDNVNETSKKVEEFLMKLETSLKTDDHSNSEISKLRSVERRLNCRKNETSKNSNKLQEVLTKPIKKCTLELSPEIKKSTSSKHAQVETLEHLGMNLKNSLQPLYNSTENLNSNSSETITDLSSISLQLPLANTVSEVSSLQTESKVTFIKEREDAKEIGPKPESVSPLSMDRIRLLKIQRTESKNMDKEFSQLLIDFNRSLTQVIQVNEQLKSTLDKSQQLLSPRTDKQCTTEYSSDFEQATQPPNEDSIKSAKFQIEKYEETPKYYKGPSKLKSSMSVSDKSPSSVESPINVNKVLEEEEQKLLPDLDLGVDLRDLSNSSAKSSQQKNTEEILEDNNCLEFEKRLELMEKMKADLKVTIKESQNRRRRTTQQGSESITSSDNSRSNKSKKLSQDSGNDSVSKASKTSPENSYLHLSKNTKSSGTQHSKTRKKSPESSAKTTTTTTTSNNEESSEKLIEIFKKGKLTKWSDSSKDEANTTEKPEQSFKSESSINKNSKMNLKYAQSAAANSSNDENAIAEIISDSGTNKENITESPVQSEILDSTELRHRSRPRRHGSSKNSKIQKELPKTITLKESLCENENSKPKTYITHINYSRGDFSNNNNNVLQRFPNDHHEFHLPATVAASHRTSTEFSQSADDEITSSVMSSRHSLKNFAVTSTLKSNVCRRLSTGAEIVKFFHRSDQGQHEKVPASQDSMSECSLNYSNVGLYDKLIQNETTKTEHLTALLKMRERALLDRTKSQIAWLEVQKARYKAKGLINNIAAIKKKQRGILLKMEKEREEIKRSV
uniref:Uncharacterized protein n=1 Tax=Glossina brevipalpis TaxID=37001 RepID=A0A1A9X3L5_9MUSC